MSRRCLPGSDRANGNSRVHSMHGFTVVEFLVASALGLLLVAMTLSSTMMNRSVYREDIVRTRINQNLRSALDILSLNARQTGQSLDNTFPAVELVDGVGGQPDQLILRRNLYENEIFPVCQTITGGTFTANIIFAYLTPNSACNWDSAFLPYINTWNSYVTSQGGTALGYIYNNATRTGEFFPFDNVNYDASQMQVHRLSGNWANSYPGDGYTSSMYLLEQLQFRVTNGTLQIVQNNDTTNVLNVVDGIVDFQVRARMQSGTYRTAFAATDDWTQLGALEVTLTGAETVGGKTIQSQLVSHVFPRNVLSN